MRCLSELDSAVVIGSPNTLGHSPKARLVVTMIEVRLETADQVEQQLPAGLREGEIAEFVEDHEVEAREIIGEPSLAAWRAAGYRRDRLVHRSVPTRLCRILALALCSWL
jgi:hypothetical protein